MLENSASIGGALFIENDGPHVLRNVTIADNVSDWGAIYGESPRTDLVLDHATITGNVTTQSWGGAITWFHEVQLSNSIVAGNTGAVASPDCADDGETIFTSLGNNVLGDGWICGTDSTDVLVSDPLLDTAAYQVGATVPTLAPQVGSAARALSDCLDSDGLALGEDAGGVARPTALCTAGAHQVLACGDGVVTPDELCDDGGVADGDGCSATCAAEDGWTCDGESPSTCTYDDWNDRDGDGWIGLIEGWCGTDPLDAQSVPTDGDGDGECDAIDVCYGDNATGDTDGDAVCDNVDLCNGDDARGDANANGTCDLLLASVGTPVPGQPVEVMVDAPVSDGAIVLVAGTSGLGAETCHPTAGVCTPIVSPIVVTSRQADLDGTTLISALVPASVPVGIVVWVQAFHVAADGLSGDPSDLVQTTVVSP
ncbi:MAG: hypothetical protein KC621_12095 [Myxococcales bacterium]|nr:hypothetical protein [Myxococcales bacterium]